MFKVPVVMQRTARKCTKIYNARAQLLFCPLHLLFNGVAVAVAVAIRELKITTTATATATSLNKRFNEENNGFARAS